MANVAEWASALPRPLAFVLSGGASLGGIQVGMLQALDAAGVEPDLLVGTSVGALHAAVITESGSVAVAADRLGTIWRGLRREHLFAGRLATQSLRLLRVGHLFDNRGLRALLQRSLRSRTFEALALPLTVVATDALDGHLHLLDRGALIPALLASAAIPGVLPPVRHDGMLLQDGGTVTNVPLEPAITRGAASLVVLDAGDVCHLDSAPRTVPDGLVQAFLTALQQRVLMEAPLVARLVPVVYLPRPCARNRSPLDLHRGHELVEPARLCAERFLTTVEPPVAGRMAGSPHAHAGVPYLPPVAELLLGDSDRTGVSAPSAPLAPDAHLCDDG